MSSNHFLDASSSLLPFTFHVLIIQIFIHFIKYLLYKHRYFINIDESITDQRTNRRADKPSYRHEVAYLHFDDTMCGLDNLKSEKKSFFIKFDESITNQRMDGPTDQRTDKASYIDARTPLKTIMGI